MSPTPSQSDDGEANVAFDDLYDLAGPGRYYAQLGRTGYRIPSVVADVVRERFTSVRDPGRPLHVLDLACGYGFNGALLLHGMPIDEVFGGDTPSSAGSELCDGGADIHLVGLDIACNAVRYAVQAGLVHEGFTDDLTAGPPGAACAVALSSIDLVIESGAIGQLYVPCFTAILDAADRPSFVYCPRIDVDQGPVDELWQRRGYECQTLRAAEPYRRPLDAEEAAMVTSAAMRLGRSVDESIVDGYITVDVRLARPAVR